MKSFEQIPWQLAFTFASFILGILFGLLLLFAKFPAGRYLGKLVLTCTVLLLPSFVPTLPISHYQIILLAVVLLFLYTRAFFSQKSRVSTIHYLPIALAFGLYLSKDVVDLLVASLITIIYLVLIVRLLRREAMQRGFRWFFGTGSRLSWLRNFLAINLLGIILVLVGMQSLLFLGCFVLLILLLVFFQVFKESEFLAPLPVSNKYKKSTLAPGIKAAVIDKIDKVMDAEFYLRDDTSLTNLAKELGVTTHHLSQVLNESLKISFQDLIARYRIRRACQILRDPGHAQVKIENVAAMVGYNSKSAFNTAFKRRTGMTPSDYRGRKDVLIYGEERLSERKEPQHKQNSVGLNHGFTLKINGDMIQQFFRIFGRSISRNALFSALNLVGLTLGFTSSILIYLYIQDEWSYDKSIVDGDRIYRVAWKNDNPQTRTPHPMAQALVNDFPEVEKAVSLSPWYGPGLSKDLIRVKNVKTNVVFEEPDFFFMDSTFFDVFQIEVIEGDKDALRKPFSLVITEQMSKKYFGDSSAVGQELDLNDMSLAVTAVVKGMPERSHFHFNAIIPYATLKQINPNDTWMTWADFGHFNYIKLSEGVDPVVIEEKINGWAGNYLDWWEDREASVRQPGMGFTLQSIHDIHLHSHLRWELEDNGNILYVYILVAILVFLIVIATINYVNLTTSKSVERAKEVGVRKALGAASGDLTLQFFLETALFSLASLIVSFGLAMILLSAFNDLSGKEFRVGDLFEFSFVLKSFLVWLIVCLMAGFYPALSLSSFRPTEVLKGKLTSSFRGVRLRSFLVIVQFSISAILISGSFIILNQIQFMREKNLGFDQEAIISLNVPTKISLGGVDLEGLRTAQKELEAIIGVKSTALTSSIPGGQFNQHPYHLENTPDNTVDASELMVDFAVADVLGFEIVEGRGFNPSFAQDSLHNILVNEEMARQLGNENIVGSKVIQNASGEEFGYRIVGIVKDFHFQSLHREIQPLMMSVQP
ncbi:MAG: ABC transporter permease, partial [Ekhidna sp.]|nr:ABC transporter permease [Ekhidna sp.]